MICEKCGLPERSPGDDIYSSYCKCNDIPSGGYPRMTLRDYIAIEVMKILLQEEIKPKPMIANSVPSDNKKYIAKYCYEIADAMLKARMK